MSDSEQLLHGKIVVISKQLKKNLFSESYDIFTDQFKLIVKNG